MRTNERQFGAFPQFVTLCLSVRRLVFPRSVVKKQNRFPRDDLVLAAMNDGCNVSSASRPAEQARRPPARDRAATLASPCRHGDPKLPDTRERLAHGAVGVSDQQRQAEHGAPNLPFGDNVVSIGRREHRQRQGRVGVFERDATNGGVSLVASSLMATPR